VNRLFSENEVREALEFLKVAEKDFEVAELLLNKKYYPQGLFMLQQSIEKTSKAILRALGIVDIETLKKEIGHRILVEGSKQMAFSLNRMFKETLNAFKRLNELLLKGSIETCRDEVQAIFEKNMEVLRMASENINKLEQVHSEVSYLAREIGEAVLHKVNSKALAQLNDSLNKLSTYIQNPLRMIEEAKIFEPRTVFENALTKLRECLLRIQKEPRDKERQIRLIQRIEKDIDRIARSVYLRIILTYLMSFHSLFEVNVSKLRYPDKEWSPLSISDDTPIVSKAKEFIEFVKGSELLRTIEEFIKGTFSSDRSRKIYKSLVEYLEALLGTKLLEANSTI